MLAMRTCPLCIVLGQPTGTYQIYATSPSEVYWQFLGRGVVINEGEDVDAGIFYLSKKLELLSPANRSTISSKTPTLAWSTFPDAVRYIVSVYNEVTGEAVFRKSVEAPITEVTVDTPLAAGQQHQWSVNAVSAQGHQIAYYSAWIFTVT